MAEKMALLFRIMEVVSFLGVVFVGYRVFSLSKEGHPDDAKRWGWGGACLLGGMLVAAFGRQMFL